MFNKLNIPILRNIRSDFTKEPIHIYTQIITAHFLQLILVIFLFVFILGTLAIQTIISQTSKFNYDNLHYINIQTESFFKTLKNDLYYISSDHAIRSSLVFSNNFDNLSDFKLEPNTKNYINHLFAFKKGYELSLFNLNHAIDLKSQKTIDTSFNPSSEKWYKKFVVDRIEEIIISNNAQEYFINGDKVVSYITPIKNYTEDKIVGFLNLDISYDTIKKLYTNNISPRHPIIILDKNNDIVFISESLSQDMIDTILFESKFFVHEDTVKINGENYLVSKVVSEMTNWKILSIISINEQLGPFTKLALILTPIIILIIILYTVISLATSKKIIKPINDLIITMKKAQKGYFNQKQLPSTNIYEIDELSSTFISMMNEINHLIDKNQKTNLLKVESQLIALQQKINPHFLFNTLELISGQAIIESAASTSEMAQKLGNLFRYNLSAPDILTIEQEVDYLNDYLYLQQIRYNNTLNININISPTILDYKIPKLTLQPIIENAIIHGFGDLPSEENYININGFLFNDNIIIEIVDNGVGISVKKLKKVNKSLRNDIDNFQYFINRRKHIGIRNVNARICLYYKVDIGLKLESIKNRETKVIVMLPTTIHN